ncbi:TRPM8 channel-associated factor 2-like [Lissotriton helveticus]
MNLRCVLNDSDDVLDDDVTNQEYVVVVKNCNEKLQHIPDPEIDVIIEKSQIQLMVDTGARITIVSQEKYRRFWSQKILLPPDILTVAFEGSKIQLLGSRSLQKASMVFPQSAIGAQLKVQIGCHTDNLSGKEDDLSKRQQLFRPPTVTKVYQVKSEKMTISTLWGGLIYMLVPGRCQLGLLSITVTGAVRAPFYKHGETTDSDWLESVRHYPAPWAEFATENIILTVPAECALAVEKPSSLMSLWDRMMAAVAELAAIPFPFWRPERIVADVQISGGWMHAGYPIMAHTDSSKELTNFDLISGGIWGPIHELGHNQQCWGWNISPNTTEATCNLWSVYVSEKVLGIQRSRAHGDLHPECREKHIKNYLEKGARLEDWTLWAALETYLQLQEAFGWAPFIQLFSDYQKMTDIKDENTYKMNLWAEKFSNQVKKNLAPFFKMWGWPIKDSVSAKLSSLPEWEENPMKKFVESQ